MKKQLLVISFTKMATDVRINRHLASLNDHFEIETIGYGEKPEHSVRHHRIPDASPYLPLTARGIASLLIRKYETAIKNTPALRFVEELISDIKPEHVLLNDVQTLPLAEQLEVQSICVADMHEYAPLEMEDDWRFRLLLQSYYTFICKKYLVQMDAVVTVSVGLAKKYEMEFGIPVRVVLNARAHVERESVPLPPANNDQIRLVHTGLAAKGRHLELMIEAVSQVKNVSLDMYLVKAPRQSRTLKKLRRRASRHSNCRVLDPVVQSELPSKIAEYDAGLIMIAPSNFSLEYSMPNKLFDCIQARRPVITGPSPEMSRFVSERNIGIVISSFDAKDLIAVLQDLDHERLSQFGDSLDIVAKTINSHTEGERLLEIVCSAIQDSKN